MSEKPVTLPKDRKQAFEVLHNERLLGAHETVSGGGSTLMGTYNLRRTLQTLLDSGVFKSILDIGCGDFYWLSAMNLREVDYLGLDIVSSLIGNNRRRWPGRAFEVMDIVESVPPPRDLALCKDLFTHFPQRDVVDAFNNIKKSGSRYLAATTYYPALVKASQAKYYYEHINIRSAPAYWRPLNLQLKPFYFPSPLWSIREGHGGRTLDIWALEDLPFLEHERVGKPPTHDPKTTEDFMRYRFFRELIALPFIQKIALYGSRAREKHNPGADIDMMIWCDPATTRGQWLEVCRIIGSADIPLPIDCLRYGDTLPSMFDDFEGKPLTYKVLYGS
jgi:hypothetical protein